MTDPATLKSPLDMLYHWEKTTPDEVYLRQPIKGQFIDYTWKQSADEVRRICAAIRARNLPPQSRIGLVSKNCAHWIFTDLAIMMSGHISVPLYPNIGSGTLNYILRHSEAKLLFIGKLDDWNPMKPGVPENVDCISFPLYGPPGYEKWEDLTKKFEPIKDNPTVNLDSVMTIVYTSGTTGNPKGVVQTFGALAFAITDALKVIDLGKPPIRFFSYLPLSHIAERMLAEAGSLYTGATVYFAESLDTFAANLVQAKPTVFLAVPRIWTKFKMGILSKMPQQKLNRLLMIPILSGIVKSKIKKGLGLDKAKIFLTGAAPMPAPLIKWFSKIGIEIQEVYGMTENCAYSHFTRKENIKPGCVGQPLPSAEVKLSDEGEILVKSPCTMKEYYKEPAMTAETIQDGYLRTGDQGEVEADGTLKITGRVKDIFKTQKGKYISPNPIEIKFSKNNMVEQVCIVGSGLPQPVALVVLSEEGKKTGKERVLGELQKTIDIINPKLDSHERLEKIIVVKEEWTVENELLTPSLKIKRSPVEKKYEARLEGWFSYKETVIWEE